ncbi:MAG TPA: efflux RND transporter periplasmic adaptor subunit [Legionellaceae bacterium]|nr:efflux RND transporter periplasmic adaptor subunit [Legionellaceae bacterium]
MLKGMLVLGWHYLRSKHLKLILGIMLIALISVMVHCIHRNRQQVTPVPIVYQGAHIFIPESSALRFAIHVAPACLQSVVSTVVIPATVQTIPSKTVTVLPPVTGQITKIYKILGESISAGEPLYALIAPDLAQALANKTMAEANYTLAQKNLARQRELAHYAINATRDLEQAESDMIQAKAELNNSIARLQALHIDPSDQDTQGHLIIRSPVTGVVTQINAGVGTYWTDLTSPIMSVADLSQVYVVASAQERDVPDFFLGQEAQIVFDFLTQPMAAQVDFIDPVLNSTTRTVGVALTLNNPQGNLRPNMFARVKFKRKPRQLILLPMTAVIQRGFDSIVFVEVAPWTFEPRRVTVGLQIEDKIEIQSGLADQERVAMTGGIILND